MPRLVDSHCHLHFPAYDQDRDAVLARMSASNIWGITVGTNVITSQQGVAFAEAHNGIFATVGYHPEHLSSSFTDDQEPHDTQPYDIQRIAELTKSGSQKIVAIGETGLDFFRIDADRNREEAMARQTLAFREHIHLAHELRLPLVVHCRNAFTELAQIITQERERGKRVRGVIHCFTGTWEQAEPLLALGFYLSFTGIITFPTKKDANPEQSLHRTIERMPLDRLLVETDAPWLTPVPFRGKRNEPAYVEHVAEMIARIRKSSPNDIAEQTTANACSLFRLD
jgi:TatD DNase family protein